MRLTFLGDVMLDMDQLSQYRTSSGYEFDCAFQELQKAIKDSDFVVANLETPIAGEEMGFTKEAFSFNSPKEFARALKDSGVDLVTTANNHCLDRGIAGLKNTLNALDSCGLLHLGTHCEKEKVYLIMDIGDIKVGLVAFTYGTNAFSNCQYLSKDQKYMVDMFQDQELANPLKRKVYLDKYLLFRVMRKLCRHMGFGQFNVPIYERRECMKPYLHNLKKTIKECKSEGADFVIACLHIGGQYNNEPLEYTKDICSQSLDAGADAVIANHEHVIHGIDSKLSGKKFCIYSLGNLLSSHGVTKEPFDKQAEYSVGINLDINKFYSDISKTGGMGVNAEYSFRLFNSVLSGDGRRVRCEPLFFTIQNSIDKVKREKLTAINNELVNRVFGTREITYPLQEEYKIGSISKLE